MSKPNKQPPKRDAKRSDDDDEESQAEPDRTPLAAPGILKHRQQRLDSLKPNKEGKPMAPLATTTQATGSPKLPDARRSDSEGSSGLQTPPKVSIARPIKPSEKKGAHRASVAKPQPHRVSIVPKEGGVHIEVPEELKVKPDIFHTKERAWRKQPAEEAKKQAPIPPVPVPDVKPPPPKVEPVKELVKIPPRPPTPPPPRIPPPPAPVIEKPVEAPKVTPEPEPAEIPQIVIEPKKSEPTVAETQSNWSVLRKRKSSKVTTAEGKPKKRVIELSAMKAAEMFGYQSKLAETNTMIFTAEYSGSEGEDTRSLSSGNTSGPDESWILDWSGDDVSASEESEDEGERLEHGIYHWRYLIEWVGILLLFIRALGRKPTTYATSTNAALYPLFLAMFVTGRLPFSGGLTSRNEIVQFSFPKNTWKFGIFCGTSVFLFLLWILTIISAFDILRYDAADHEQYEKLEDLYLEKYWLQISIFLAMLTYVNIVSIATIVYGDYLTIWLNHLIHIVNIHHLDLTKWVWIYGVVQLALLAIYSVYMIFMFRADGTPGVLGGTNAIAVVLFHFLYPGARLNFLTFPHLAALVLVIQLYVLFCARLTIMFPMLCSILVRNMAQHRNLRIALLLGTTKIVGDTEVGDLRESLTYRNVFRFHRHANELLRAFCNFAFPYHICAYYTVKCGVLCLCLFKIAKTMGVSFFPTTEKTSFNDTAVRDDKGHVIEMYADPAAATIFDTFLLLGISLLGFLTVSEIFSDCSKTFLDGFSSIRPYSLFRSKGSQERKFVMSLSQCFTEVNPYVVSPSSLFEINRRFIIRILEWCGLVFMIMIQTQSAPLLKSPIYGICDNGGIKVKCIVAFAVGPRQSADRWSHVHDEADKQLEKFKELERLVTSTTQAPQSNTTMNITTTQTTTTKAGPGLTSHGTTSASNASQATTSTTVPTTTKPTAPTTTLPPLAPFVKRNPNFKLSRAATRCNGTDIVRPYGFDVGNRMINLPSDRFECIVRPYDQTKQYFDAWGRNISEWDDCGFPKFPLKSSYKAKVEKGPFVPEDPVKATYITKEGKKISCWDFRSNSSDELLVSPFAPEVTCGYPTDYYALLCDAAKKQLSIDDTRKLIESNPPPKQVAWAHQCDYLDFRFEVEPFKSKIMALTGNETFQTRYIIVKKESVSSDVHAVFVRFIAFRQNGSPWPIRRNTYYDVFPYVSRSILDEKKPAPYYDCTGNLLENYDTAGFLGFPYFTGFGIVQRPDRTGAIPNPLPPVQTEQVKCFVISIFIKSSPKYDLDTSSQNSMECGILSTDPNKDSRITEVIEAFQDFNISPKQYIGEN